MLIYSSAEIIYFPRTLTFNSKSPMSSSPITLFMLISTIAEIMNSSGAPKFNSNIPVSSSSVAQQGICPACWAPLLYATNVTRQKAWLQPTQPSQWNAHQMLWQALFNKHFKRRCSYSLAGLTEITTVYHMRMLKTPNINDMQI